MYLSIMANIQQNYVHSSPSAWYLSTCGLAAEVRILPEYKVCCNTLDAECRRLKVNVAVKNDPGFRCDYFY